MRLRIFSLRGSSFAAIAAIQIIGIFVNSGGDFRPELGHDTNGPTIQFGWPYSYGEWNYGEPAHEEFTWKDWWRVEKIQICRLSALCLNVGFWLCLSIAIGGIWEWRRINRPSAWQPSRLDLFFAGCLCSIAAGSVWYSYSDWRVERRIVDLTDAVTALSHSRIALQTRLFDGDRDVPADWFWETFHVPHEWRPYRTRCLVLLGYSNGAHRELPGSVVSEISKLSHLKSLVVRDVDLPAEGMIQFGACKNLEILSFGDCDFHDDHLRMLPALPRLKFISLSNVAVSDIGIKELSRQPVIEKLMVYSRDSRPDRPLKFHSVSSVSRLQTLNIIVGSIDDESLFEISSLRQLRELSIVCLDPPEFTTPLPFTPLSEMESLKNILIDFPGSSPTAGDAILQAVTKLPRLEGLTLNARVTDQGVTAMEGMTTLQHLTLRGNQLTDKALEQIIRLVNQGDLNEVRMTRTQMMTPRIWHQLLEICPNLTAIHPDD